MNATLLTVLPGVALLGLAAAAYCARRPLVTIVLLVALDSGNITGVISLHTGVSLLVPMLALGLVVLGLERPWVQITAVLRTPPAVALGLILLASGATLLTTTDWTVSAATFVERLRDAVYFLIVVGLLCTRRTGPRWALAGVVLALAGLAGLTVVHQFLLGGTGDLYGLSTIPLVQEGGALTPRHAGTSADVNFWARQLVMVLPPALALAAVATRLRARLLWGGCAVALVLGTYLTQSRGGFLALGVGLVVWMTLSGPRARRALLALPVVLAVVIPLSGIGSRLATLAQLSDAPTRAAVDPSLVTRERFQEAALRMFLDRPVTGQGIGTYGVNFPSFDRLAGVPDPIDITVAAHNLYLEQAADGGLPLLAAWLFLLGATVFGALLVRRSAAALPEERQVAVGLAAAFVAWGVASAFLHLSDPRMVITLVAVVAVLQARVLARAAERRGGSFTPLPDTAVEPARHRGTATGARRIGVVVGIVVLGGGLVGLVQQTVATARPTWTSTTMLPLVSTASDSPWVDSYQQDLVSRGTLAPTFATVLQQRSAGELEEGVGLLITPSELGGAISVAVTGTDPWTVAAGAALVVGRVGSQVETLSPAYRVSPTAAAPAVVEEASGWGWVAAGAATVTGAVVTRAALVRNRRARSGGQGFTTRSAEPHGMAGMLS